MYIRSVALALLLNLGAATAEAQEHTDHTAHAHDHGECMPLLDGLGRWHQRVTTALPDAQKYFDQGLRLAYGFNHEEAARSFGEAMRLDPTCAMCAWGVAYALAPNINLPMDSAKEMRALAAIRQAQELSPKATSRERDYIAALALRFGEPAGAQRAARDSAYANAMRAVAQRYPDDADAQVLFADAMLNLRPWNQWTREGTPQPGTLELVDVLERVVDTAPEHAGACHFYVHAVEASPSPERALECAERLPKLMPGAGHVVHMPARVYLRTGQYEKAARANIAAVEAVIMLHGYSDSWFSFSPVMPLLPPVVRAIAVDMRGHGNSGDIPPSFRVDDLAADVAAERIPTMRLWGDRDTYFPPSVQQAITTRIPGARLIRYEGIGHAVHWEDPARVASDLVKFMAGL